jgi:hypothetical protein
MRLAVALPGLEREALDCRALEKTLSVLARSGVDIEGFAEHDRLEEGDLGFPVFHYLRMPERNDVLRFDQALYPLGRDAAPYQAAFWLMGHFPGVVWLFDSVLHHLALGGYALWGKWTHYRELLRAAYGNIGPAVAHTVAGNWGTSDLFRHIDLVAALTRQQRALIASWPALATQVEGRDRDGNVAVAELPLVEARENWEAEWSAADGPGSVAIVSLTSSNPSAAVAAAAGALEGSSSRRATLCTSKPAHRMGAAATARRRGIADRIDWVLDPSWVELADVARRAVVSIWLDEDLRAGERLLILHGLSAGKPTIVPRSTIYADLPEGAVAKVDMGRSLGPEVAALMQALIVDTELKAGLQVGARAFASEVPEPLAAAAELQRLMGGLVEPGGLKMLDLPGPILEAVRQDMFEHVVPVGAGKRTRQLLVEILDETAWLPRPRPQPASGE